ncbi:unnamed protein product, partial [Durusdinium trenchii]
AFRMLCRSMNGGTGASYIELLRRLNEAAEEGRVDAARELYLRAVQRRGAKNRVICNTFLKALANAGETLSAEQFFEEMEAEKVEPNAKTFGKLIEGAARVGDTARALHWFHRLSKKFHVDVDHYNMLARAFFVSGDLVTGARWLFEETGKRGIEPDIVGYNQYLDALSVQGRLEEAQQLFQRLQCSGIRPNVRSKTLRQLGAMLAYDNDLFIYRVDEQLNEPDKGIYMFTASCTSPSMPTSDLAQRLRDLQLRLRDGKQPSPTMWQSRPTVDRVAMQCTPQDGQDPAESEYAKQMGAQVESKTLLPEAQSSAPNEASPKKKSEESGIAQYDLIRMAAAEYLLKKTGMDSLDQEEFKAAVEAHIAKAAEEAPELPKTPVKTEGRMKISKKKMMEPVDILSSEEEKAIPNAGSAASGQH